MNTEDLHGLGRVAIVIPCFRCAKTIEEVVSEIPDGIGSIICVNDASDDNLGQILQRLQGRDARLSVITHTTNRGVGGATISGYQRAIESGAQVIVKIDSDGQMNPAFIPEFVEPILAGEADYVKGNRFFDVDEVRRMPIVRLIGNAALTFLTRFSSGYWELSDPTNGYTAISARVAAALPLNKVSKRFFFESDMLFRLYLLNAVVSEQPIETRYGNEISNLSVVHSFLTFPFRHIRNLFKRIFYSYFLRNFDAASLNLIAGIILFVFGATFGAHAWIESAHTGQPATAGTVMLSATPLLIGFQLLLSFLHHDVARAPRTPIHPRISRHSVLVTLANKKLEGE